jgi:hypothetical protein
LRTERAETEGFVVLAGKLHLEMPRVQTKQRWSSELESVVGVDGKRLMVQQVVGNEQSHRRILTRFRHAFRDHMQN